MATKGEDMVCQLNMNQVGRTGGIYVKAEDILDIIDGYKGGGYGVSTQHELGARMLGLAKLFFKQKAILLTDAKGV